MTAREALKELRDNLEIHLKASPMYSTDHCTINSAEVAAMIAEADEVLAKPERNCDVGTVEEQEKRWRCNCGHGIPRCCKCAVYAEAKKLGLVKNRYLMSCDCKFIWAQMPYEEADGEIK